MDAVVARLNFENALLAGGRNRIMTALLEDKYETSSGKVYFIEGEVSFYSLESALTKLQDLHFRCTEQKPILAIEQEITVEQAKSPYRVSATLLLAQIAVTPKESGPIFLDKIISVALKHGSTEGLESIFLTAYVAAADFTNNKDLDYYLSKFSDIGWPKRAGGGFLEATVYDRNKGFISISEKSFGKLVNGTSNSIERLMGEKQALLSGGQCMGYNKLAGMICGATLGFALGGGVGAATGAAVGSEVGEAVGDIRCTSDGERLRDDDNGNNGNNGDNDDDDDDDKPKKEEKAENGCVAPDWEFYRKFEDPYKSFAMAMNTVAVPSGKGLHAFIVKNQTFSVTNVPLLELGRDGQFSIKNKGLLSSAKSFGKEITRLQSINRLNSRGSFDRSRIERGSFDIGEIEREVETLSRGSGMGGIRNMLKNDINNNGQKKDDPMEMIRKFSIRKSRKTTSNSIPPLPKDIENMKGKQKDNSIGYTAMVIEYGKLQDSGVQVENDYIVSFPEGSPQDILFGSLEGEAAKIFMENPSAYIAMAIEWGSVINPKRP